MEITEPDHSRFINNYKPRCSSSSIFVEQWRRVARPTAMTNRNSKVIFVSYLAEYFEGIYAKSFKGRLYCHYSHFGVVTVIGCYFLQRRKAIFMAPWSPFLKKREVNYLPLEIVDVQGILFWSEVNPFNTLPRRSFYHFCGRAS